MNQSSEFSEFIAKMDAVIDNGRAEAKAPKGSLGRMRFAAIRQGRTEDADNIAIFLGAVTKEIDFFRRAAAITSPEYRAGVRHWLRVLQRPITPTTFRKLEESLSPMHPFTCVEGVFARSEKNGGEVGSSNLKGPFFAAVAHNTSEAIDLKKGTLVCLFSQAHKNDKAVELRVWNMDSFGAAFSGKKFDQSAMVVPPDSNGTILELHKGPLAELFKIAAQIMVRASLSRNPPQNVAEEWMALLKEYGGLPATPAPDTTLPTLAPPVALSALEAPPVTPAEMTAAPR